MRQDMEAKSPQTMKLVYYRCKMIRNTYIIMYLWIFNFMYDFRFVLDCGSTAQTKTHTICPSGKTASLHYVFSNLVHLSFSSSFLNPPQFNDESFSNSFSPYKCAFASWISRTLEQSRFKREQLFSWKM